jgi:hypothetical protein
MNASGSLCGRVLLALAAVAAPAIAQERSEACWIRDVAVFGDEVT